MVSICLEGELRFLSAARHVNQLFLHSPRGGNDSIFIHAVISHFPLVNSFMVSSSQSQWSYAILAGQMILNDATESIERIGPQYFKSGDQSGSCTIHEATGWMIYIEEGLLHRRRGSAT